MTKSLKYYCWVLRKLIVLVTSIITLLSFAVPASGITFGREVTNGSTAYPSVVSIWYAESAASDASFICTGTLIQPRIVLTAAHCVLSTGLYYVQYGANQLFDEADLLPVAATWKNPRYSARQMVNDVGLLLLETEIEDAQITRLPTSAEIKKIQGAKEVKYEIVGWGKDQNDELASYLRKAAVDDQTAFMKKFKGWRNDVWFAVGKWNNKEKVFAGSCNGDSGGPLFATVGTKKIIAGVTSWGAEDCETKLPSVYARLSYYVDTLVNTGIPSLYTNEIKQNRALPSVISEPKITGDAKVNSTLTCETGLWSSNTKEVVTKWSTNNGWTFTDASNQRLSLGDSVASDTVLTCTVTGTNNVGTVQKTASVTLLGKPTYAGYLSISGIDSYATPKANTEVKCLGVIWGKSPTTTSYKWMIDGVSNALSNSPNLTLTGDMLKSYSGKRLTCTSSATNSGGTSEVSTTLTLPTLKKPSEPSIDITYFSPFSQIPVGTVLDCSASAYTYGTPFDSLSYRWGFRSKSGSGSIPDAYLASGSKLTLDSTVLVQVSDKIIYCYVTVGNIAGEETYFLARSVAAQISVPSKPTPIPTPTPTPTPIPTPIPTPTPTLGNHVVSSRLGVDGTGAVMVYANESLNVTAQTSDSTLVEYVVFGLKPAASSSFYDWGRSTLGADGTTWSRTLSMPSVDPAPTCSGTTSSSVVWEVKYLIRLKSGQEILGVLSPRIARVVDCTPVPLNISVSIIPTTTIPSPSALWGWEQILNCSISTTISAMTTYAWVTYPNSSFNENERTVLSSGSYVGTRVPFILAGDFLSVARGKYFGCESTAIGSNQSVTKREMFQVNANATILNTALSASWSPLRLKGTTYSVTLSASKGSSPRAISAVYVGVNQDCETTFPCGAVALTLASGTTSTGTWVGVFDLGRVLGSNESLTIYLYDTDNRQMALAPRINQWGVIVSP